MTDPLQDPFDTPEARAWARDVITNLVPMIAGSAVSVSIVPDGESDVKFAIELGLSIMLDKPIVLAITPGQRIPEHLVRVADEIVEINYGDPNGAARLTSTIARLLGRNPEGQP